MGFFRYLEETGSIKWRKREFLEDKYDQLIYKHEISEPELVYNLRIFSYADFRSAYLSYMPGDDIGFYKKEIELTENLKKVNRIHSDYLEGQGIVMGKSGNSVNLLLSNDVEKTRITRIKSILRTKGITNVNFKRVPKFVIDDYIHKLEGKPGYSYLHSDDLFKLTIIDALDEGCTDIHCWSGKNPETKEIDYNVKFRIPPDMVPYRKLTEEQYLNLIETAANKASRNISGAEEIGGISSSANDVLGKDSCSLRIQASKSIFAPSAVIRVIPGDTEAMDLEELGFSEKNLESLRYILQNIRGFTIITGETGSGKNTTIYSLLKETYEKGVKIDEFSSPVEVYLPHNQKDYMDDVDNLLELVKQSKKSDPDVIFVAELATAEVGEGISELVESDIGVITSTHLRRVFLHPKKFYEYFGKENYKSVLSRLAGVVTQTMFKELCEHCKKEVRYFDYNKLEKEFWRDYDIPLNKTLYERNPEGCIKCTLGFKKRGFKPVAEVLPYKDDLLNEIVYKDNLVDMETYLKQYVYNKGIAMEYSIRDLLLKGLINIGQVVPKNIRAVLKDYDYNYKRGE